MILSSCISFDMNGSCYEKSDPTIYEDVINSSVNVRANGIYSRSSDQAGEWVNANIYVTNGNKITFDLSGQLTISPGYGYADNDGRGKEFRITAGQDWKTIKIPATKEITVSVAECNEQNNSKWTWAHNWHHKYTECWYAFGQKVGCEEILGKSVPWSNTCSPSCTEGAKEPCWEGDNKKFNQCGLNNSCWNTKGRGLSVKYDGKIYKYKNEELKVRINNEVEEIELKIEDPDKKTYFPESELIFIEGEIAKIENQIIILKNDIEKSENDINAGIYDDVSSDEIENIKAELMKELDKNYQNKNSLENKLFYMHLENDLIGGYDVYLKGIPKIIFAEEDQNYLLGCISSGNPNKGGDCITFSSISNKRAVTSPGSGALWLKIYDPEGTYHDNSGSYNVSVSTTVERGTFSHFISNIVYYISIKLGNIGEIIFKNITCSGNTGDAKCTDYLKSVRLTIVLYIIIYTILFIFGMVQVSQYDLLVRIFKVGIVATLLKENSWDFFNNFLFNIIIHGSKKLIIAMAGNIGSIENPFAFLDSSVSIGLLDSVNFLKLVSLIFSGSLGIVYFALMVYGLIVFATAIFHAVKAYILSYVFIAMLLAIAPIFIPFMLFKVTSHLFEKWIKLLFRYMIEPVIIIAGLVIINNMLLAVLNSLFSYSICYKCAFPFEFNNNGESSSTLFCIDALLPWGYDNYGLEPKVQNYISISGVIAFLIFTNIMKQYVVNFASDITSFLTETFGLTPSLTSAVGVKNLLGRQGRQSGQGGEDDDAGFFKRTLGLDSKGQARRKRAQDIQKQAMINLAKKPSESEGDGKDRKISASANKRKASNRTASKVRGSNANNQSRLKPKSMQKSNIKTKVRGSNKKSTRTNTKRR